MKTKSPPLNYTTKIDYHKTTGEIMTILGKNGARSVLVSYNNDGLPDAISFQLSVNDVLISYQLPCNYKGVYKLLCNSKVPASSKTEEQALRVAWRIVKDWTEAQMAMIQANVATMSELFFQYAQLPNGKTLYREFEQQGFKLLS